MKKMGGKWLAGFMALCVAAAVSGCSSKGAKASESQEQSPAAQSEGVGTAGTDGSSETG